MLCFWDGRSKWDEYFLILYSFSNSNLVCQQNSSKEQMKFVERVSAVVSLFAQVVVLIRWSAIPGSPHYRWHLSP